MHSGLMIDMLDSGPKGPGSSPKHSRCVVLLSKTLYPYPHGSIGSGRRGGGEGGNNTLLICLNKRVPVLKKIGLKKILVRIFSPPSSFS